MSGIAFLLDIAPSFETRGLTDLAPTVSVASTDWDLVLLVSIAAVAGLLHVVFFYLESIAWGKPATNKIFGIRSQADAESNRAFAFNQGFYNLFLAFGIFGGLVLPLFTNESSGFAVVHFCMASIFGAGLVLYFSTKNIRGALTQAGPPLVYFLLLFFY